MIWSASFIRRAVVRRGDRRRFDDQGDTLIEVLLALVILGMTSVALLIAFSTTISASATHRQVTTADIVLGSASQQAIAGLQQNSQVFGTCYPNTTSPTEAAAVTAYNALGLFNINTNYGGTWTATVQSVSWWNGSSFSQTCTAAIAASAAPQLITIQISGNGHTYTNSFVVDYPLATANVSSYIGNVGLVDFTSGGQSGVIAQDGVVFPSGDQPVVQVYSSTDGSTPGNLISNDLSPVTLSITSYLSGSNWISGTNGAVLSGCYADESGGSIAFNGCSISKDGTYRLVASTLTSSNTVITSANSSVNPYYEVAIGGTTTTLFFTTQPPQSPSTIISGGSLSGVTIKMETYNGSAWVADTAWSGDVIIDASGNGVPSSACNPHTTNNSSGPNYNYFVMSAGVITLPSGCTFQGSYSWNGPVSLPVQSSYTLSATWCTPAMGCNAPSPATTSVVSAVSLPFSTGGTGVPAKIVFTQQPEGVIIPTTGGSLTAPFSAANQPTVTVEDAFGNPVFGWNSSTQTLTNVTGTINVTISGNSGNVCSSSSVAEGSFSFTTCHGVALGPGFTMSASGSVTFQGTTYSNLPVATSLPFNITNPANSLQYTTSPSGAPVAGASGQALEVQPTIDILDQHGWIVTASTDTLQLSTTNTSTPSLANCTDQQSVNGVVSIQSCTFAGLVNTPYTFTATDGSLSISSPIEVTGPGVPSQLVFTTPPVAGTAGRAFTTEPVLKIEDSAGNVVTSSSSTVTLSVPSGAYLSSNCLTLSQAITGVVTPTNCIVGGVVETPYNLTATDVTDGLPAVTAPFVLLAPAPTTKIVLSGCATGVVYEGPGCVATATLEDQYGNTAADNSAVTFSQVSGTGTVTTATVNAVNGVATYTFVGTGAGTPIVDATAESLTSNTLTFPVNKAQPIVNWTAPSAITYPTALSGTQLNATATYNASSVPGTFVYTPASGTVLSAGAGQTLSVNFTPTDTTDYQTATGSTTLTVNKAQPIVNWTAPSAITYPTALSGTQLNATATYNAASVPGTFVYTPASGTVLSAGAGQAMSVNFTPTDTTDYQTATGSTTLTVNKATPAVTIAFTAPTVVGSTPITVQATVAGNGTVAPTGTISWTITGVTNPCTTPSPVSASNATASCTITNAAAGVYTFIATYNPGSDVNYVTAASTTYGAFFGGTSAGISSSSTNKYFAISSSSAGSTTVGGITSVKPTANSTLTTQYGNVAAAPGSGKTVTVSVLNTSSTVLMTCSTGNSTSCSVAGPVSVTSSTGLLIQATDSSGTASKVTWFVTFTQP